MRKVAAVFDLDGTLLNTIEDIAYCANAALSEYGFPIHDTQAYYRFVGVGADTMVGLTLPRDVSKEDFKGVFTRFTQLYDLHAADKTAPYEGIPELLRALQADGVPMAVVTNKAHERAKEVIEAYFPGVFQVVYGQRPGVPVKPDPAGVIDALRDLGVAPADVFYLGDTEVDIETGKRAGIYSAGVLWGFRTAEELAAAGADILVATPAETLKAARDFFASR